MPKLSVVAETEHCEVTFALAVNANVERIDVAQVPGALDLLSLIVTAVWLPMN